MMFYDTRIAFSEGLQLCGANTHGQYQKQPMSVTQCLPDALLFLCFVGYVSGCKDCKALCRGENVSRAMASCDKKKMQIYLVIHSVSFPLLCISERPVFSYFVSLKGIFYMF